MAHTLFIDNIIKIMHVYLPKNYVLGNSASNPLTSLYMVFIYSQIYFIIFHEDNIKLNWIELNWIELTPHGLS